MPMLGLNFTKLYFFFISIILFLIFSLKINYFWPIFNIDFTNKLFIYFLLSFNEFNLNYHLRILLILLSSLILFLHVVHQAYNHLDILVSWAFRFGSESLSSIHLCLVWIHSHLLLHPLLSIQEPHGRISPSFSVLVILQGY